MAESPSAANVSAGSPTANRRRKWTLAAVVVLGTGIIAWECYQLMPDVRVAVVRLLGKLGPWTAPTVHGYLEDADGHVQGAAAETLIAAGAAAVPSVSKGLAHADPRRRCEAISLLQSIGPDAREALPELTAAARQDPDMRVRRAAVAALPDILGKGPDLIEALVKSMDDPAREVRLRVVILLARVGPEGLVLKSLARALDDVDPDVRAEAAESLGGHGASAREAVPALARALMDAHQRVRWEAAEALGNIGPQASAAVPGLAKCLQDSEPRVRTEAAVALGKIGPAARAAIPDLRAALDSVGWPAKKALEKIDK